MILVSFFSEDNVLSDEKKSYIFEYQSNENRAFRFFRTPGIDMIMIVSSYIVNTEYKITYKWKCLAYLDNFKLLLLLFTGFRSPFGPFEWKFHPSVF